MPRTLCLQASIEVHVLPAFFGREQTLSIAAQHRRARTLAFELSAVDPTILQEAYGDE
jgi:hypothetical protein